MKIRFSAIHWRKKMSSEVSTTSHSPVQRTDHIQHASKKTPQKHLDLTSQSYSHVLYFVCITRVTTWSDLLSYRYKFLLLQLQLALSCLCVLTSNLRAIVPNTNRTLRRGYSTDLYFCTPSFIKKLILGIREQHCSLSHIFWLSTSVSYPSKCFIRSHQLIEWRYGSKIVSIFFFFLLKRLAQSYLLQT